MSLPMGRGSMLVRSCGLVSKQDGIERTDKERYLVERKINACIISVLLSCNSRKEQLNHGG
jgi:hypothetical protein